MTVALVLATTAVCHRASRPGRGLAAGGSARAAQRVIQGGVRAGRGDHGPATAAATASFADGGPVRASSAAGSGAAQGSSAAGSGVPLESAGTATHLAAMMLLPSLDDGAVRTQPLLARLCGQLGILGIRDIILIAPRGMGDLLAQMAWEGFSLACPWLAGSGGIDVIECGPVDAELREVAAVARRVSASDSELLICPGDLVMHTEALARLRRSAGTAALTAVGGAPQVGGPDLRPPVRLSAADNGRRGVAAAGSAFHRVHAPDAVACGPFLVAATNGAQFADAADELACLAAGPQDLDPRPAARHGLSGFTDAAALLLVGLVRGGAAVEAVDTSPLVCVRVRSLDQARAAAAELTAVAEDRVRLDAAVKRGDGLFATCVVRPYSRYVTLWSARRRLSPNAITGVSIALAALAAIWFSAGGRAAAITGVVFLLAAFTLDRVDGELARYARRPTAFGAWLDAVGGRLAEFGVYAGLAAGAALSPPPTVWQLAVAAAILQALRDVIGFCVPPMATATALSPPPLLPLGEPADYAVSAPAGPAAGGAAAASHRARWPRACLRGLGRAGRAVLRLLGKIIEFQPGERVAVIGVTEIVAGPRMTFLVLLAWGGAAAALGLIGRIARS